MSNSRMEARQDHLVAKAQGKSFYYEYTCGACPNQFEGFIGNTFFYFRARHEHWSLCVGPTLAEAIGGRCIASGEDNQAGWWSYEYAENMLLTSLMNG